MPEHGRQRVCQIYFRFADPADYHLDGSVLSVPASFLFLPAALVDMGNDIDWHYWMYCPIKKEI